MTVAFIFFSFQRSIILLLGLGVAGAFPG